MSGLGASAQYWAWRTVSATVGRLPIRASYGLATAAGTAGYYLWPRGRRATHANFRRVLPGASREEVRRVARRSLVNYCRYLADFVRFPRLGPGAVVTLVDGGTEFASLEKVLEDGRGAVIVCMHFGNWDLGAAATAARGYHPTVVADTFADPRLDAMVLGARERLGMRVAKVEQVGPSLLRALKRNGLVALLIDQPRDGDGVRVRFFGGEIAVPAGPARIALRSGAKVIPTAFARVEPGKPNVVTLCDFGVELPHSGDREQDIQALTQAIVASHEAFIRRYPDQWYMFRPMFVASGGEVAA